MSEEIKCWVVTVDLWGGESYSKDVVSVHLDEGQAESKVKEFPKSADAIYEVEESTLTPAPAEKPTNQ